MSTTLQSGAPALQERFPGADLTWQDFAAPAAAFVIAGSAGGILALRDILARLPPDFPAPVLLAQHRASEKSQLFVDVLNYAGKMRAVEAREGERPQPGRLYVAPADAHLEVTAEGTLSVAARGRIDFVHPSADLLFRSAAAFYGERLAAIVLTGRGHDGAEGAKAVRRAGGFVIAQDPATCDFCDMPEAAIETRKVDLVLSLPQIPISMIDLAHALDMPLRKPARRRAPIC